MKKILAVVAAATFAFPAVAGNLVVPTPDPEPIVVDNGPSSSISPIAIIAILLVIGLLVSQSDSNNN